MTHNDKILVDIMRLIKDGQQDILEGGADLERNMRGLAPLTMKIKRDRLVRLSHRQDGLLSFLRDQLNRMHFS